MRLEVNTSQYYNLLFTIIVFSIGAQETIGQVCSGIYVANAVYQTAINGYYYIGAFSSFCNSQNTWSESYFYNGQANYIQYLYNNAYTVNGTQTAFYNGWTIGPTSCRSISTVVARQSADGTFSYPYDVPSGTWQEFNPYTQSFFTNRALTVSCAFYLTAGEIVGIVIGSICVLCLLIALLACCCAKICTSKAHRTQPRAAPTETVIFTTGSSAAVVYATPLQPTVFVKPPQYSNAPPPAYVITQQY